jgi:hypothetical protein
VRHRAFACWPAISKKSRGVCSAVQKAALLTNSPALAAIESWVAAGSWANTPEIRASIKLSADVICEKYVAQSGLFNYFNKIDEEIISINIENSATPDKDGRESNRNYSSISHILNQSAYHTR